MRYGIWVAAVVGAVWVTGSAHAQIGSPSTFGPSPTSIVSKPMDLTNVITPMPAIAAQQSRFNFTALFSKLITPTYPLKTGVSPLPPPSAFPTYSNFKMVGQPPYQLGDPRAAINPFQPVLPLIPNNKTVVGPGSK